MRRAVETESTSLTRRLAGTFTPTEDLYREADRAQKLNDELFARTRGSGALRADADVNDIGIVLEQVASIELGDRERTNALRQRYLTLRSTACTPTRRRSSPAPPPTWQEIAGRWNR